ncbi:uncharacterized protein PV09_04481 [Verruconis gallopava]|uniref:FAD/NAD(P)-binding domain-containing protein n=1 Tax=Verruconis gallopava TaxID=253628 RepID=A0A0D2ACD0_9PEZI|nr:uncharacterized protein PV09_04481 [Verruconis gallopava]KIW04165.1 hypothetical protein PV09_04481 [Verruconis gallopava]
MTTSMDLRSIFPFDNGQEHPDFMKYTIDSGKPMKVINIGARYTGVVACIRIPRKFANIEFKCYEKNHDVDGTWLDNTYPGVAYDVPSHEYQTAFETNPNWTQCYSTGNEIWKYFKHIAVKYDAEKYITFNTKMIEGRWQGDKKLWKITLKNVKTGEVFTDVCNVLFGCVGNLNRPHLADIPGRDTFKGSLIHPARWNHNVDIKGKKVAVIVNVEGVHETRGAGGVNFRYSDEDTAKFQNKKEYYKSYERTLRDALACLHLITFKGSPLAMGAQKATAEMMRLKSVKDPSVAEAIIPDWAIGCRRLTPGTPYIEALCEEKRQLIKEPIECFDASGIITKEGTHRRYDVIILASGYEITYQDFPLYGRNGVNLNDIFEQAPESYLGVCPPEMPILGNPRWEDFDYELMDEEEPFAFFGNGMTEQDMDMKGNFAPYMDIEAEYPELREFFGKEENTKEHASLKSAVISSDNADPKKMLETDGIMTTQIDFIKSSHSGINFLQ